MDTLLFFSLLHSNLLPQQQFLRLPNPQQPIISAQIYKKTTQSLFFFFISRSLFPFLPMITLQHWFHSAQTSQHLCIVYIHNSTSSIVSYIGDWFDKIINNQQNQTPHIQIIQYVFFGSTNETYCCCCGTPSIRCWCITQPTTYAVWRVEVFTY